MSDFELPANIKQIGSIDEGLKIYAEDYVCTYLKQYAESGGHCEKIAFLVGKHIVIDSQPYIFINGVIQGKFSEYIDGMEVFTDESYEHAEEQLGKYFKGSEIVGWMQSQPGYGVYLNPSYADYHMNNFTKPYQVMFVMDPVEKLNVFYAWDESASGISETTGYFIYYDQNKGMQEYMMNNKISKIKSADTPTASKKPSEKEDKPSHIFNAALHTTPKREAKKEPQEHHEKIFEEDRELDYKTFRREGRTVSPSKNLPEKSLQEYKRMFNMLVSLSAVLFVVCFIMGAGLIQSDGRIATLENKISGLDTTYVYLSNQIKQINSQTVFANQSDDQNITDNATVQDGTLANGTQTNPDPIAALPTAAPTQAPTAAPTPTAAPPTVPTVAPTTAPVSQATEAASVSAGNEQANAATYSNVPQTYIVQQGDSLYSISRKFYGTIEMVEKIMTLNEFTDADTIISGKEIKLPQQ